MYVRMNGRIFCVSNRYAKTEGKSCLVYKTQTIDADR